MASHIADVCNVGRCAALQTRGQAARAYKDLIRKEGTRVLQGPELSATVLDSPDFSMRHKPATGMGSSPSPLQSKLLLLGDAAPPPLGGKATGSELTTNATNLSSGGGYGSGGAPDPAERAQALGEAVFQSPVLQVFERNKRQQQQHRVDLQRLQQWAGNHSRRLGLQKSAPPLVDMEKGVDEGCDARKRKQPPTGSPNSSQLHTKVPTKAPSHQNNSVNNSVKNDECNLLQAATTEPPLPDAFQHFRDRRAQIEKVNAEHGINVPDQWASSPRFLSAFRSPVVDPNTGGVDTHTTEMRAAGQLVMSAYEREREATAPHARRRQDDLPSPPHQGPQGPKYENSDWRSVQAAQEAQIVEQMRQDMHRLDRPQRSGSPLDGTATFPPGMTRRQWLLRYRNDEAHRPVVDSPPRSLSALDRMFVTPKKDKSGHGDGRLTPSPLGNAYNNTTATASRGPHRDALPLMLKSHRSNDATSASPPLPTRRGMYDGLRPVATGEYFLTVEQQRIQLPAPRRGYQQPSALFPHAKSMVYDGNNFKSRTVQRRV